MYVLSAFGIFPSKDQCKVLCPKILKDTPVWGPLAAALRAHASIFHCKYVNLDCQLFFIFTAMLGIFMSNYNGYLNHQSIYRNYFIIGIIKAVIPNRGAAEHKGAVRRCQGRRQLLDLL